MKIGVEEFKVWDLGVPRAAERRILTVVAGLAHVAIQLHAQDPPDEEEEHEEGDQVAHVWEGVDDGLD